MRNERSVRTDVVSPAFCPEEEVNAGVLDTQMRTEPDRLQAFEQLPTILFYN